MTAFILITSFAAALALSYGLLWLFDRVFGPL